MKTYIQGARTYIDGQAKPIHVNPLSAVLEVELSDGRTVQLTVDSDGNVYLRGWGNIPAKLGNSNSVELLCQVNPEKQTHCPMCCSPLDSRNRCCEK